MDGVVCDFITAALLRTKEIWNIDIAYEEITNPKFGELVYERMSLEQKKQYPKIKLIYKDLCPIGFFENLKPYDGAIKTLKELCELYEVFFITKALEWQFCPGEKYRWLEKHLPNSKYGCIFIDRMEDKKLIDVDVLIEDDERALNSLTTATGIAIRRPWNQTYLKFNTVYATVDLAGASSIINNIQGSFFN
jgi:5'(3')-deoxyribonucleotidase